ncbi:MAG: hypothetical protein ACLQED_12730 [Desulfobaccales bacterium]
MKILVLLVAIALSFSLSQTAYAEEKCCWINAKTGKQVPSEQLLPEGAQFGDPEHNHASIPGYSSFVRGPDNSWINVKTGKQVPCEQVLPEGAQFGDPEHNHASIPGYSSFVRVPCPPPAGAAPPAQSGTTAQPQSDTGSSVPGFGFGFGLGGFGRGQDRNKDSGGRP